MLSDAPPGKIATVNTNERMAARASPIRLLTPWQPCLLSTQRTSAGKQRLLLLIGILLLGALSGCTARQDIENGRARGAEAGHNDGQHAGEAEGFTSAFKAAESLSYGQTLSVLYSSGNYHQAPTYAILVLIGAFLLGFALQYALLYLLCARGFLYDIDGIVLPQRATALNLRDLSEHVGQISSTQEQTNLLRSEPTGRQGSG